MFARNQQAEGFSYIAGGVTSSRREYCSRRQDSVVFRRLRVIIFATKGGGHGDWGILSLLRRQSGAVR